MKCYILNHMVKYKPPLSNDLDSVFSALSDATRRGILAQLSLGETTVSKLAEPYAMSQPAISKHLRVLERAGLIRRTRRGREHHIQINPRPIEEANGWIAYYANVWQRQFDAVGEYLQQQQPDPKKENQR